MWRFKNELWAAATLLVFIVVDDPLAHTGLATLLTSLPGCMVVGQME